MGTGGTEDRPGWQARSTARERSRERETVYVCTCVCVDVPGALEYPAVRCAQSSATAANVSSDSAECQSPERAEWPMVRVYGGCTGCCGEVARQATAALCAQLHAARCTLLHAERRDERRERREQARDRCDNSSTASTVKGQGPRGGASANTKHPSLSAPRARGIQSESESESVRALFTPAHRPGRRRPSQLCPAPPRPLERAS